MDLPSDVVMMCGCVAPNVVDRVCVNEGCGLPNMVAMLDFRPVVRVLKPAPDDIRRCDCLGCCHHHHAKGRCRQHYDAERRAPAPS